MNQEELSKNRREYDGEMKRDLYFPFFIDS